MIGLPKVQKNDNYEGRGNEFSPHSGRNGGRDNGSGYPMMSSHTNINDLKMPQLVDRNMIYNGAADGGLPSL